DPPDRDPGLEHRHRRPGANPQRAAVASRCVPALLAILRLPLISGLSLVSGLSLRVRLGLVARLVLVPGLACAFGRVSALRRAALIRVTLAWLSWPASLRSAGHMIPRFCARP